MKQKFIQKYLELEMALSDTEEMLKLLFSAIKYDEENDVKGSYSYLVGKNGTVLTANCPNCGAPVSDSSARICRYCDSLLVNPLGGEWKFTDISEG